MKDAKLLLLINIAIFLFAIYFQFFLSEKKNVKSGCPTCEYGEVDINNMFLPQDANFFRYIFPANPDFAADVLWLRTNYFFGYVTQKGVGYEYLPFYLDIITDLAPKWKFPYIFAAVILPFEANLKEEGDHFIEKGIKHLPNFWELWLYKAYYLWKVDNDYSQASQIFAQTSKIKGAPSYFAALSTTLALKSGDNDFAKQIAMEVIKSIEDEKNN